MVIDALSNFSTPPIYLINQELQGIYGSTVLADMNKIIKLYDIYEKGAAFDVDNSSFSPSTLRYKCGRSLIDKETRFMFSRPIDVKIKTDESQDGSQIQRLINSIIETTKFNEKLLKAGKDCAIGKRVACFLTFNSEGVGLRFAPSLEFVYDTMDENPDKLSKIIAFYTIVDSDNQGQQKVYRKKYWMENGYCWVEEGIYNGAGELIEERIKASKTKLDFIPAIVILNGGLSGDMLGTSDMDEVVDYEAYFSKLNNADMDAGRKSMYPTLWTRDISPTSTKNINLGPGAYLDLSSDPNASDGVTGEIGQLESSLPYGTTLDLTLKRLKATMHEQLDIPDIANMQQKISSGKELEVVYWGLTVRCDEKFVVWRDALKFIFKSIIKGVKLYPESNVYGAKIPLDLDFDITIENQYPLLGDEAQEKELDLAEVTNKTRSIKSYLRKWNNMTDQEAEAELQQIALEKQLLEESYFGSE